MSLSIEFGFLAKPVALDVPGIRIRPVADHSERLAFVQQRVHKDGFFYPPEEQRVRLPDWPDTRRREPVPNTKRPAHLFRLPTSHTLEIDQPASTDPVGDDAGFIAHLLAYVYGTRLQPEGWQFDARVPITQSTHFVWVGQRALERLLVRGYDEWRAQSADRRLRLTNILYMHARAPSYDWEWEEFFTQYLATDAIYDYCFRTGLAVSVSHGDRIRELCGRLGVWCPSDAPVDELVRMRNTLFHEALWEGERPGYRISSDVHNRVQEFRQLNHKLIAALLGGVTDYTRASWTDWRQMDELQ